MLKHILRSLFSLLFAALVGSIVIFALVNLLGGDIVTVLLGKDAAPGDKAFMREELGLDDPLVVQYLNWLRGVLTGDLGTSYGMGYDISDEILRRLQPTLMITIGALVVSIPLALALGTFSAVNAKKVRGGIVDVISQVGIAIPTFWAGLLLVLVFGVRLGWLPTGGFVSFSEDPVECLRSIILPILALSLGVVAVFTRYVRSAMIDVMNEDFIRSAMARGRSRRGAALVHGVRNASIPLVTVAALQFGALLAGAVVVENVFVLPGIGKLIVTATLGREVIVVQSLALVIMLVILTLNFLVDVAYGFLDPRIRDKAAGAVIEVETIPLPSGDAVENVAPRPRRLRLLHLPIQLYIGGALVLAFVAIALLSFVWTPYPPNELHMSNRLAPPGTPGFPLGTDRAGRDVVTELMLGARNSLYVSVVSTIVALITGAVIGLAIAGARSSVQGPLTRFVDAGLALPGILTALVLAAKFGPGNTTATVAIIIWQIPVAARVTIGPARQVLALDFVEAAYAYGRRRPYVLVRHVLPNVGPLLIVLGSVMFAAAILIEAALAFLGVGVQPPTSSWGRFLSESQSLLDAAPYLMFFPGGAIVLTALGFNLLGDGLRTALDPQQSRTGLS